ncbi:MAG: FkbM family methyltransferase [Candidatus Nanopelagicales bacterium]
MTRLPRLIRIAITPRSATLKTRTPNGAIVVGRNRPGHGGRGLFLERDSLEPEIALIPQLLPVDGVFVDVGASTGVYSMTAAQHLRGSGTVVAVEPTLEILGMLERAVELNGFHNVRLRNLCLAARTGARVIWHNFGRPNQFSLVRRDEEAEADSVLAVALDDLMRWEGLTRLDFVKIDVEGSESEVLEGASESIGRYLPVIQVEDIIERVRLVPTGYLSMVLPGSPNHLLVHSEDQRVGVLRKAGARLVGNQGE